MKNSIKSITKNNAMFNFCLENSDLEISFQLEKKEQSKNRSTNSDQPSELLEKDDALGRPFVKK